MLLLEQRCMNLRTNVKVKFKIYSGGKLLKIKWFTIRYSDSLKRFLLRPPVNYIDKNFKLKGIKCDITVHYTKKKDDINSGIYDNHREALNAFKCFTEQDLIKEFWDKVLIPKRVVKFNASWKKKMMEGLKRYKEATLKKSL